jgi:malonyl CoA-acyl carrier protein transacylase
VPNDAIAGLFPGQGSQSADLRAGVERFAPDLLERCCALVGEDPFPRVAQDTRFAQPAIYCASIASWIAHGPSVRPIALAGHSLGELSALVAAEALTPQAGLQLAVRRGELMSAACARDDGMLAVVGASEAQVAQLVSEHGVFIANHNSPDQVVVAGSLCSLRAVAGRVREWGARAVTLEVAGAFHAPGMAKAAERFRAALDSVEIGLPTVPVISGSSAAPFKDVRAELAQAIVRPVRWRSTMLALSRLGAHAFIDFGPGAVVARLVRRNLPDARVIELGELEHGIPAGARNAVA